MKASRLIIGIACLMVLAIASVSNAQAQGMGACCRSGGGAALWNELSPEQQKQMTSLRVEFLKKIEGMRSEVAQKRIEMMELASKDKPDEQAIEKKRQEIWALKDSMRNDRRAMGSKIRGLLTPEQKQKLGPLAGLGIGKGGMGGKGCGGECPMMGRGFGGGKGCCGGGMSNL